MFNYCKLRDGGRPYIIAEIGANHNGNMELAKKLIVAAKECGADCAKFQSWTKSSLSSKTVYENVPGLEAEVERYHIGAAEHRELKRFCDEIGIDFNSTPFSNAEVDLLVDELKVPFIKVASMDLNNTPFLKYIASKQKPVVLSTGLCGLSDIAAAVSCLEENGCREIALLHCVSLYPPKDEQVNLNNIDMLRMNFGYPVGYSDHTLGVVAPILSLAKGVCIIEKHFTLDKELEGWDHKVSAEPVELRQLVDAASIGYKMFGSFQRVVVESDEQRRVFQRSIVAARDIKKGCVMTEEDLAYKRPGSGLAPSCYVYLIGKPAKRDICRDELIRPDDF